MTVFIDDKTDDDRELTPDEEAELTDAIAEADRVGWIPAEQVIAELRRQQETTDGSVVAAPSAHA